MTENVIYVCDSAYDPPWTYYSMPHSCVGGGDTLDEARATYRQALAFTLEVDESDLPPIREHVEREAVGDVYIRYALGDPERSAGTKVISNLLRDLQLQKTLHTSTTTGGYPVLVVVQPQDTLAWVIGQMTGHDSLWLVTPIEAVPVAFSGDAVGDGIPLLGIISIVGPLADDADQPFAVELDQKQIESVTVDDLFRRYGASPPEMVSPEVSPRVGPRVKIPVMA